MLSVIAAVLANSIFLYVTARYDLSVLVSA